MLKDSESEQLSKTVEDERATLRALPFVPYDLDIHRMGVLLSDQIQYYCEKFKLIDPYERKCLRPAGYDLRVGSNVSINGVKRVLKEYESFSIGPYQVAVIETHERLNMPEFLIGRWNIRVALAYDGLLWVGGAQVDPGFRGHLTCPIYNLSDKDVNLTFGQPMAMLDFVTTTKVNHFSAKFDWENRKKIVFAQYDQQLVSGITTRIEKRLDAFEKRTTSSIENEKKQNQDALQRTQSRIDTFVVAILTVISVLFAGLGVVATRSAEPSLAATSISLASIAAVALYFALRPYYLISKMGADIRDDSPSDVQVAREVAGAMRIRTLEWALALAVVVPSLAVDAWSIFKIQYATSATFKALQSAEADRRALEKQIGDLRQQDEARAAAIERDVRALEAGKKDK